MADSDPAEQGDRDGRALLRGGLVPQVAKFFEQPSRPGVEFWRCRSPGSDRGQVNVSEEEAPTR